MIRVEKGGLASQVDLMELKRMLPREPPVLHPGEGGRPPGLRPSETTLTDQ